MNAEERTPQSWYAIVEAYQASLRSYLDHYGGMEDPKLEAMPSEGENYAKLSSSLFTGQSVEDVKIEAHRLVQIITGAAKIKQAPGNLILRSVVAVYADGETKRFRHGRIHVSSRGYYTFKDGTTIKDTFEKSVVLFSLRCRGTHPQVDEVLCSFAQSDDWAGLYRILETIGRDLNENDAEKKTHARDKIKQRKWASISEISSFYRTADSYRHNRPKPNPRTMLLDDAQNLIGRIVEAWLREVARRLTPP